MIVMTTALLVDISESVGGGGAIRIGSSHELLKFADIVK